MLTGTRQHMQACGSGNDSDHPSQITIMTIRTPFIDAFRSIHGLIGAFFIERSDISMYDTL